MKKFNYLDNLKFGVTSLLLSSSSISIAQSAQFKEEKINDTTQSTNQSKIEFQDLFGFLLKNPRYDSKELYEELNQDKKNLKIIKDLSRCYNSMPDARDHPNWA
jgi:hypothetical protein